MNKIYKLIIYILLGLAISITLYSIYLVNIEFILRGFIHIIFLTSLLLLDKLDGKNRKIVEITFWISSMIIIISDFYKYSTILFISITKYLDKYNIYKSTLFPT